MKQIALTQGKVALVDDEDFERLVKIPWTAYKHGKTWYAIYSSGPGKNRINLKLHRQVLGVTDPAVLVDHRDRDGLNCQRYNLRAATHAQNMANRAPFGDRKIKGAYKSGRGRWRAQIRIDGKVCCLGRFNTEQEAGAAYDVAAIQQYGEFALTNAMLKEAA